MKRITVLGVLLCLCVTVCFSQLNLQFHYDLGRYVNPDSESDRQLFTATLEFFKADRLGSTFLFIDMDYRGKGEGNDGPMGAYWEMSRDFTFAKSGNGSNSFSAHIEYDGGLNRIDAFQQALLAGPAWQWHSNDFTRLFTMQVLYKQMFAHGIYKAHASFQLTAVWEVTFAKGLCTFSGYGDLWYGYTSRMSRGMIFMSEPQLWFNVYGRDRQTNRFSVGTEWELSHNFIWATEGSRRFFINPTVAVKYTF